MRIFKTFKEALSEIPRDLKEMGLRVGNIAMQDKHGEFPTLELVNYSYAVLEPNMTELGATFPWAEAEWRDRLAGINGNPTNPGSSLNYMREDGRILWDDYLEHVGVPGRQRLIDAGEHAVIPQTFSYTYGERLAISQQVWRVIMELRRNPMSRQLYVGMWDIHNDPERIGERRVPCSLGWHFMMRGGALNVTYTMRSCDFLTHFRNDVWMACALRDFIAAMADPAIKFGSFTHFINSLHVYERDVADVF